MPTDLELPLHIERTPSHSPHRMFLRGGVDQNWQRGCFDIYHIQEQKSGAGRGQSPVWQGFSARDEAVMLEIQRRWNVHAKLVDALKGIAELPMTSETPGIAVKDPEFDELIGKARAAVAS